MSNDQVARLAATIEVLTGAVNFLVAERVAAQPDSVQGELLHILQRAFSTPRRAEAAPTGRAVLAQADLALWMPIVARGMMDDVWRQISCEPEGVTQVAQGRPNPERPSASSEMAERAVREHARGAVAHFEHGRAVA